MNNNLGTRASRYCSLVSAMHSPLGKSHAEEPGRKSLPHLSPLKFANQSIIIFVSCNVAKRRRLLARPEIHRLILESWRSADHWLVGRYVIMPDHIHFFYSPRHVPRTPLKRWMEFWRRESTLNWPHSGEARPIWQKDFFDRQLRSGDSYTQKWHYEWQNPVVAGLVKSPDNWPFQGELNPLMWHEPN